MKVLILTSERDNDNLIEWIEHTIQDILDERFGESIKKQLIFQKVKKKRFLLGIPKLYFWIFFPFTVPFYIFKKVGLSCLDLRLLLELSFWKIYFLFLNRVDVIVSIEGSGALYKVANSLGLLTLEVQHGVFPDDRPLLGRTIAAFRGGEEPQHYVVWDKVSEEIVSAHSNKKIIKYSRVLPQLISYTKTYDVLVTLQWGLFDVNRYDSEQLDTIGIQFWCLEKLLALHRRGYSIVFKLHPASLKRHGGQRQYDRILELFGKQVLENSRNLERNDVIEDLARSKIHLTLYSSCILEAASQGIKSIVVDSECLEMGKRASWFKKYVDQGLVEVANRENLKQKLDISVDE